MLQAKLCLSIILYGSIMLVLFGCDEPLEEKPEIFVPVQPEKKKKPDLSQAISKRIEGDAEGAIRLLRNLNEEFPNSQEILIQLGRSLADIKNHPLAAFRFEQAVSCGATKEIHLETAEAHLLAGDKANAEINFDKFLRHFPQEKDVWLTFARLLAEADKKTEAINAFSRVPDLCNHEDALTVANLFYDKKLWAQSARWFRESAKRENGISPKPLLGLLRISLIEQDEDQTESLCLAIEKTHPGSIDSSDISPEVSSLLRRRRLADLLDAGIPTDEQRVSVLAKALLSEVNPVKKRVVSSGSKLPPPTDAQENLNDIQSDISLSAPPSSPSLNLADAFAKPAEEEIEQSSLEKSRTAYLNSSYTQALYHAREALKANTADAEAWRLCSQAHFQLGEEREAEMTILEAIRHNPFDLVTRLDYLRIARETLPAKRYLAELEKSKELFPESTEILWELARRYHLVEKMPVTASILYNEVLKLVPESSGLYQQAKLELFKLQSL